MTKNEIKNLLEKYNLKPKKYLGQNFLIDEESLNNIVLTAKINKNDIILEIGPGIGNLTKKILETEPKKLIAIEKDKNFCEILKKEFKNYINQKKLIIINNDVLKIDFEKIPFFQDREKMGFLKNFKIIGNIPYYLTSRLIRKIFESQILPKKIILTIQKEVAQRICAKPPKMNLLAISIQIFGQPEIIKYIGKSNFWPQPKIDSAIIKIAPFPKPKYQLTKKQLALFFKIIKAAFSGKRKQIINTLSKELKISKNKLKSILNQLNIDEKSRPENLPIKKWIKFVYFLNKK